jgi:3-hydroxybutyryl-CoA dehydrogenase
MVIGAGTMGGGIAQVAAAAGCHVDLFDAAEGVARSAVRRIAESLGRAQQKGYVTPAEVQRTLDHLHPSDDLAVAAQAHAVIEAVKEDVQVKQQLFARLEAIIADTTPIWTNTSMLSITRLAQGMRHPERLVGTHFFNPAPRMKLVEVTAGEHSDEAFVEQAAATMRAWGKTPVRAPDSPGFIVNRIFDAIKREALQLLSEGTPADQIDAAVKLGLNFPMGPFETMDLVGLDTTYQCLQVQAAAMGRTLQHDESLAKLVGEGNLGRKTGRGFYTY